MRRLALPALRHILCGALAGAACLGIGGRIAMRGLAHAAGEAPRFSIGGSTEILLYGALIGAATGAAASALRAWLPATGWRPGLLIGALAYAGTIATLPAHIWALIDGFAASGALVAGLFGLCFLAFGLMLGVLVRSGNAQ